jgi:hypothetical protein
MHPLLAFSLAPNSSLSNSATLASIMVPCHALAELVKHYPFWRCESLPEGHEHHCAHLAQHHPNQPSL